MPRYRQTPRSGPQSRPSARCGMQCSRTVWTPKNVGRRTGKYGVGSIQRGILRSSSSPCRFWQNNNRWQMSFLYPEGVADHSPGSRSAPLGPGGRGRVYPERVGAGSAGALYNPFRVDPTPSTGARVRSATLGCGLQPLRGRPYGVHRVPGCAPRPWAAICNPFGVKKVQRAPYSGTNQANTSVPLSAAGGKSAAHREQVSRSRGTLAPQVGQRSSTGQVRTKR